MGTPSVLFVCVKNGGKSQIAAAIMRQIAGDSVEVHAAGTRPGPALNAEAEQSVREVGASFEGEHPKPVTPELLASVDRVVLVGTEAQLDDPGDTPVETWDIDEPSLRGIAGDERMRLVRDDITGRVIDLAMELTGQPVEHGVRYRRLVDYVSQKFDGVFTPDEVRAAVHSAHASLASTSRVPNFLPLMVERFAVEQLTARAVVAGKVAKPRPHIVFVCVHNAGRSQIAAALAHHLSGGRVNVSSAGSRPSGEINPMALRVLQERGVPAPDAYPKPLTDDMLLAADVVITMGCGDECPYHPGRRYEDWTVADPEGADLPRVREIADDIQIRVTKLLSEVVDQGRTTV